LPVPGAIAKAVVRKYKPFSLARDRSRAPEHGVEVAGGRQVADDATNKFNQCVLRLVSFNWMSILRQMPYFDLRHSDFFFTPAREVLSA